MKKEKPHSICAHDVNSPLRIMHFELSQMFLIFLVVVTFNINVSYQMTVKAACIIINKLVSRSDYFWYQQLSAKASTLRIGWLISWCLNINSFTSGACHIMSISHTHYPVFFSQFLIALLKKMLLINGINVPAAAEKQQIQDPQIAVWFDWQLPLLLWWEIQWHWSDHRWRYQQTTPRCR